MAGLAWLHVLPYDVPMVELDILGTKEKHQILNTFNVTEKSYPETVCIQDLF